MTERKCDHPVVFEKSNGRATCPDRLFNNFKMKDSCGRCPKALSAKGERTSPLPQGELEAIALVREIKESVNRK